MPIPDELEDGQLLFDHALCHALFMRKKDVPDALPDWSVEDLVDYHWLLQGEMEKRGLQHRDFDDLDGVDIGRTTIQSIKRTAEQIKAKGLYLPAPHARLIWTGQKKLLVKCRSYGGMLNKPLYWGDADYIYGVLKLTDIVPIDEEEFKKLQPMHHVTMEERRKWWPDSHRLYTYEFLVISRFKKPRPYRYQRGTQVFFPSPEWKSEDELTVAVDLDGTIADTDFSQPIPDCFLKAKPKPYAPESMQEIHDIAAVIIYTGRDPRYYELTANWLKKYKIPYDELVLGKPVADMYVDDLAVSFEDNWQDVVGITHTAAELLQEEKQDTLGPGGETGIFVQPTTFQETTRIIHASDMEPINFDYDLEDGQIIYKAAMPKANKPARRFYDVKKVPSAFKIPEVLVEIKFDGMDMMISKEKTWSGRGLDKTSRIPYIMEELKKWPHESFTLHGQAQMFSDEEPMHRTVAIGFLNGNAPVEEGKNLRITVFDIIELDGKDLTQMPMLERLKILRKEFKGSPHVPVIKEDQFTLAKPSKLVETCERMAKLKGSEGAMLFDPDSRWQKHKTINFGWSKWKKLKEIDILVVKKERKEAGWRYLGAIGPINESQAKTLPSEKIAEMKGKKWLVLGHTHVSSVEVAEGDILRVQALELVRNDTYDYSYQNAVPMYTPEKNVPDGLDVAEDLAKLTLQKSDDVAGYIHVVDREGKPLPSPEEITRDVEVRKQLASDPDSGAQNFMPGRTTEGVRTTGPSTEPASDYSGPEGATNLEKIVSLETYDPRRIKDKRVLLDDHRITHAWWSTLQSGKPLKHDKATVRALHNDIAREIERRGMLHNSPLSVVQKGDSIIKADGGFTYAPGGIIGVPGIGGGERVPDAPDNRFPETHPEQYTQVDTGKRPVVHTFFHREDEDRAKAWQRKIQELANVRNINVTVTLEPFDDLLVGSIIFRSKISDPNVQDFCREISEIQKQLWPAWVGHRADPHTGKPLPSEHKPITKEDELFSELLLLSEKFIEKDPFMEACVKHVSGWVKDPQDFCGAFWKDKDQWYHGPQKTSFVSRQLEASTVEQKQMPPEESTAQTPATWTSARGMETIELADWSLEFLGTSGEKTFPRTDCSDEQCRTDKRLNSSAVYTSGATHILLDVGSEDLAKKTGNINLTGVCFTHAHSDHIEGILHVQKDVPIYMHRETWRDLLDQKPTLTKQLEEREIHLFSSYNSVKIGNSKVRWIPVKHSLKVRTFAIRINRTFLYCPDFLEIENKWLDGITHWIIDGASMKRDIVREQDGEGYGHQSILHSLEQAEKNRINQVVITHVGHTGIKADDMPEAVVQLAQEANYQGHTVVAVDNMRITGGVKKSELDEIFESAKPAEGTSLPARFYKGPNWLHTTGYTYIIHHHFPYGPIITKDQTIQEGSAADVSITGPGPSEAGGKPPKGAVTAPRDPAKAEAYVKREFGLEKSSTLVEKGVGGFREHWETRQDTGESDEMIGWTFLTYPWNKTQRFFSGSIKGMCTAKPSIPKKGSKKFPRGWLDVQGLRKPIILGGTPGSAERTRSGFLEILEEGTFEYGVQRKNLHEYFFHGKLLNGRWIFRLLQLASGSPRWLAFHPPDQKPMDPEKHADDGYWKLVGETEASVQSPGEEKKPMED